MTLFKGNPEHLEIIKKGTTAFTAWRKENPKMRLDLRGANLPHIKLRGIDLAGTNLSSAELSGADFSGANLRGAVIRLTYLCGSDLRGSSLSGADLSNSDLSRANLHSSDLSHANLSHTNFSEANLTSSSPSYAIFSNSNLNSTNLQNANLIGANLVGASLINTNFDQVSLRRTIFAFTNISQAKNLEKCNHRGPSIIDFQTLQASYPLPVKFLRGCGLADDFIDYLPEFFDQPIQYYSLFISYSTKDEDFAKKLYNDLQNAGIRCWYAPKDMKAGMKQYEQISIAIHLNDRLLLILSEESMKSNWVRTEITKARLREEKETRNILFPIRLIPIKNLENWELFDIDLVSDSARKIREYHIPSFENWQDEATYQQSLQNLIRDLKK